MFLKSQEYKGQCEATLEPPEFPLDAFQELPFKK